MRTWESGLEEVAEFEVKFPAGGRLARGIDLVEAVAQIEADGSEGRDHRHADAGAPEEPGRVVLSRALPDVAGVEERADVEGLGQPQPDLRIHQEERVAERRRARLPGGRVGVVALGRDGELNVAAQGDAEWRPAQGEELVEG